MTMENPNCEVVAKEVAKDVVHALILERKKQGLTQQMVADHTGMKTSNVTRVESCKNTPTIDVLIRYADALGKKLRIELIDK